MRAVRVPSGALRRFGEIELRLQQQGLNRVLFMRRPQISKPGSLAGGDLKYCAFDPPVEIATVGKTEARSCRALEIQFELIGIDADDPPLRRSARICRHQLR